MADANIAIQSSNLFSLNANFKTQSSGTNEVTTNVTVQDEYGNVSCETNLEDITNYTQEAQYCGSAFLADIGILLTQFGDVQGGKVVTGLTINGTAGEYCSISVEGHNHAENAHVSSLSLGYADMSDILPHEVGEAFAAWNGFGVPDFGVTLGAASPASFTVTLAMNHIDQIDEAGDHLVGKNITPRAELSMDFSGIPTSNTIALLNADLAANTNDTLGAIVDSVDSNDSNSEFDTFAFTAHAHADLEAA